MKVSELIEHLKKMPQDKDVIMFDGPSYYTPYRVEEYKMNGKDCVIID